MLGQVSKVLEGPSVGLETDFLSNFGSWENVWGPSRESPGAFEMFLSLPILQKIGETNWGSQNRSRNPPGAFLAHPGKTRFWPEKLGKRRPYKAFSAYHLSTR